VSSGGVYGFSPWLNLLLPCHTSALSRITLSTSAALDYALNNPQGKHHTAAAPYTPDVNRTGLGLKLSYQPQNRYIEGTLGFAQLSSYTKPLALMSGRGDSSA